MRNNATNSMKLFHKARRLVYINVSKQHFPLQQDTVHALVHVRLTKDKILLILHTRRNVRVAILSILNEIFRCTKQNILNACNIYIC